MMMKLVVVVMMVMALYPRQVVFDPLQTTWCGKWLAVELAQ